MRVSGKLLNIYAAAILAFSPAISIAAQPARIDSISNATFDVSKIAIENFGRVNGNYYRGAQPEGRDYADLAAFGIRTVVDLQKHGESDEAGLVQSAGMTFHRIPMTTHEPPTSEQLAQFLQLVNDPAHQPVFVHCAGGRHRTGVMTAAYRMTNEGWSADQAYDEMKRYKFGPGFLHPEFKEFVYDYHAELAQSAAAQAAAK